MALKANIIANYVGQGWRGLMSLAFVPVYIHYLGIEAYGLIGLFATLLAWLGLLDLGLRPVLTREMARYTGGAHDAQSIADLLRSIECTAIVIAVIFACFLWVGSNWFATHWVKSEYLSDEAVAQAFSIMGLVVALQFLESLYSGALAGLQQQVLQNIILVIVATLRAVGAVAVLKWYSPTVSAFFIWQGLASLFSVLTFAFALHYILPRPPRNARFTIESLSAVRLYAGGMIGISILSFILTQTDKILLSKLLPLELFARYMLASAVASSLSIIAVPIAAAFFPRFTELVTQNDKDGEKKAFHDATQIIVIPLFTAAAFFIIFGDRLLLHWTQDPLLAQEVAPLLAIIVIGTAFNALFSIPYMFQLAHGWTSLSIKINLVAVAILVPAILIVAPRYGAMGTAMIWAILNASYVLIGAHFMFSRLLTSEKWEWYIWDICLPIAIAFIATFLLRLLMPEGLNFISELAYITTSAMLVTGMVALSSSVFRDVVKRLLKNHNLWLVR